MAYYTALTTAWNNASLSSGATLPTSVSGSLLTGLTTAQKLAAVNAWTIPGPTSAITLVAFANYLIGQGVYPTFLAYATKAFNLLVSGGSPTAAQAAAAQWAALK